MIPFQNWEKINQLFSLIVNFQTSGVFFYIKIFFIAVSVLLLFFILILLLKTTWLQYRFLENAIEFITYKSFGAKKTFKKWLKISKRLESGQESEYKLAVIEADDLLAEALEAMEVKGKTIEEKLENIDPVVLPEAEKVLQAHKVRNEIVYNPDRQLTLDKAKEILYIYEKVFRNLELI
jgi:hypothetical protein